MIQRRSVLTGGATAMLFAGACQQSLNGLDSDTAAQTSVSDEDEFRRAFHFAYPIYEYARIAQNRTQALNGTTGHLNVLRHRSELMDHRSRNITGPNVDTLYSSAFLDLSGGPLRLSVPTDFERYFSIAFMNIMTDNFAYIGTRETGGRGGEYLIVGPNSDETIDPNITVIRCDSNDVWMLGRTLVSGPEDLDAAVALQTQIALRVPASNKPGRAFKASALNEISGESFLNVVNDMLSRSPSPRGELTRASQFQSVGIGQAKVAPDLVAKWDTFIPKGLVVLREKFLYRDLVIDGWAYQERGVGNFGTNDTLRAAVALGGLAALGEEEAMYFHANLDPDGTPLRGNRTYRWRVPAGGLPADAFWSLTMYETLEDGRHFLTENPINRYAIGDRTTGLIVEPDGSFEILIQHEKPSDAAVSNWLPAPKGRFRLALRTYLPRKELQDRTWTVPALLAEER